MYAYICIPMYINVNKYLCIDICMSGIYIYIYVKVHMYPSMCIHVCVWICLQKILSKSIAHGADFKWFIYRGDRFSELEYYNGCHLGPQ